MWLKRKLKHIVLQVAKALVFHSNLPKNFWGKAILTIAYLIN